MRYQLNRTNQIFTVLDDEDNVILHEHYVKDTADEAWISVDENTQSVFQTMIDRGLPVRFDPKNNRYGYFHLEGDDPNPRKPKRERKAGIGRKSRDLPKDDLDKEINSFQKRLVEAKNLTRSDGRPLNEQQVKNIEDHLSELKKMDGNRADYKAYQSESEFYMSACRTLSGNLVKAIEAGDNQSADSYWNVMTSALNFIQKTHDDHQERFGMKPSTKEFVYCDEFGEWSEPDRSKMPADHLEPYIRPRSRFRNPAKKFVTTEDRNSMDGLKDHTIALAASKRFMEYSERIEKKKPSLPLMSNFLEITKETMEEKAWENLSYVMPTVDNRQSRMMERLGFDGMYKFASELLGFRKEYLEPNAMSVYGNRNVLLSGIQSAYDRYGLRRCSPSDVELKLREFRKERRGGSDLVYDIEHLL